MAQAKFIPNAGQWKDATRYRCDITGGRIYLCNNEIRYHFINSNDLQVLHRDPNCPNFTIHGQSVFLQWENALPKPAITRKNEYPEKYNFFIGSDPSAWKSGLKAYSELNYAGLYKGIDLLIDGDGDDLKYTYTVAPGTDPSILKMKITGASDVYLDSGDLVIHTTLGDIIEKSPFAWQWTGDEKIQVPCNFAVHGNEVTFSLPQGYDKSKTLTIDPVVIFATYSGSKADNFGFTGTYDQHGDGYSGGDVFGAGFPTKAGAYQVTFQGGTNFANPIDWDVLGDLARDCGILKYSPDGKSLLYATYLGGVKGNEQPHSMIVDRDSNLVVIGTTASADFPITSNAFQKTFGGKTDIFVSRFSPDGSKLLSSTFVGGSNYDGLNGLDTYTSNPSGTNDITGQGPLGYNYGDQFRGEVVVDNDKNVYVATTTLSSNFPVTSGSFQNTFAGGTQDGCVFKLDSSLSKMVWGSYLGGNKQDAAYSIQLDNNNNPYVCGGTLSPYFFSNSNPYQKVLAGDIDGFICHIKNDGSAILGATYLGTTKYDQTFFVQLDQNQDVYVYGQTESSSFLVKNVKYYNAKSGNFITKFNPGLDTVIFSAVFGSGKGLPDVSPTAFLIDKCGKIYISGWGGDLWPELSPMTKIGNMPITSDAYQPKTADGADFYVAVFERNFDTLLYSSYFGGPVSEEHVDGGTSRFDKNGVMYQSVCGGCQTATSRRAHSDFPTTPGAWSRTNKSYNCNNLLFKVDLKISTLKAAFIAPKYGCLSVALSFNNTSSKAKSYFWDFGDGVTSTDTTPKHLYKSAGTYTVTLIATDPNSCQVRDTFKTTVTIYGSAKADYKIVKDTCGLNVTFLQTGISSSTSWNFGDGAYSHTQDGKHKYAGPGNYIVTLLVDSGTKCVDTFKQKVDITGVRADFKYDFEPCKPQIIDFTNLSAGELKYRMWYLPYASTDTAKNPVFDFQKAGTYDVALVIADSFGCKDSIDKKLTIAAGTRAAFTMTVDTCALKVTLASTSTAAHHVAWILDDGTTSDSAQLTHTFAAAGTHKITLVAEPGLPCADTTYRTVTFTLPKASFDYTIDTCSGLVHFSNNSKGAARQLWQLTAKDTSTAVNPQFYYTQKGTYPVKLTITTSQGCIDSFTKTISIDKDANHKLFIPNVFTPNADDNINRKFVVDGLNPCYIYDISIYNRWGQLMFYQKGNALTWDGFYNGILVPEGVYYYVFHGEKEGMLKGAITVLY